VGHPAYLEAKAEGDKSIPGKQEASEDVYGADLQDPCDMVKAGLLEAQFPVVKASTPRHHIYGGATRHPIGGTRRSEPSGWWAMVRETIEGNERATYVALETSNRPRTEDHLRDASPMVTESP